MDRVTTLMRIVIVTILANGSLTHDLTAPDTVTAFTGSVKVSYVISPDDGSAISIRLQNQQTGAVLVAVYIGSARSSQGQIEFQCGSIDQQGLFQFALVGGDNVTVLATSNVMTVRWPRFTLSLPTSHETLSGDIPVQFGVEPSVDLNCSSKTSRYSLDVVYSPSADTAQTTLVTLPIQNLKDLWGKTLSFSCPLFDQEGSYQALLKSSKDHTIPMASSNKMDVKWSTRYAVSSPNTFILPCKDFIRVFYTQPQCPGVDDKIRLYKSVPQVNSSASAPRREIYVSPEKKAVQGTNSVVFFCDQFDDTSAVEYCFAYVSVSRVLSVRQQDKQCLPLYEIKDVDGNWTSWTDWTTCSVTCGSGQRLRVRECSNPPPSGQGKYCDGPSYLSAPCDFISCQVSTTPSLMSYNIDPACVCGCQLASSAGRIVTSTLRCNQGSSVWIITAPQGYLVRLTFVLYHINPNNYASTILVRDGKYRYSPLLVRDDGSSPPRSAESTQNSMMIEFTYQGATAEEGFVVDFESFYDNRTIGQSNTNKGNIIWSTTIIIISVLLFIFIICVIMGFICYHLRVQKRNKHYKQSRPSDTLLMNGEPHTSPSHSNHTIKGSVNLSYGNPASTPTKAREYIKESLAPDLAPNADRNIGRKKLKHSKSSPRKSAGKPGNATSPSCDKDEVSSPSSSPMSSTVVQIHSSQGYQPVSQSGSPQRYPHEHSIVPPSASRRGDNRNTSFMAAVVKGPGPAMAEPEDLSPQSPLDGERSHFTRSQGMSTSPELYSGGLAPPGSHHRAPADGKDSSNYKLKEINESKYPTSQYPDIIAMNQKPQCKPLPLRRIERPDGQSPGNRTTPEYCSPSGLSPVLKDAVLFPDMPSKTPSEFDLVGGELEYDDYVPDLPGSFFNMDPNAYTLTWSQKPSSKQVTELELANYSSHRGVSDV